MANGWDWGLKPRGAMILGLSALLILGGVGLYGMRGTTSPRRPSASFTAQRQKTEVPGTTSEAMRQLIAIAKALEPPEGYFSVNPYGLLTELQEQPEAHARFAEILLHAKAEDFDHSAPEDDRYAQIVLGAADALDLLPDDPRLFLSATDLAALPRSRRLEALQSACIVNDVMAVQQLAGKVNVNRLSRDQATALSYAIGNNHMACVRILLAHGANPNRRLKHRRTALHFAAELPTREIFDLLVAAGGQPDLFDRDGISPRMRLVTLGRNDWLEPTTTP